MDSSLVIDKLKEINFNKKLTNELNYLKDKNNNLNFFANLSGQNIDQRIELLDKIINQNNTIDIKKEDNIKQKKDNLFTEIDKYTYKKQWNKLPAFHKIVKIKEFIKCTYGEGNFQDELINKLSLYANEGKINTKKYVIYDPNLEKILSIPSLIVDINKKTYQLKMI